MYGKLVIPFIMQKKKKKKKKNDKSHYSIIQKFESSSHALYLLKIQRIV